MTCVIDMLGCTSAQCIDQAAQRGISALKAIDAYRAAYRAGRRATGDFGIDARRVVDRVDEGATTKFTLSHGDGRRSESVLIPYRRPDGSTRTTLCVSSQIGCAMGCAFCETAQLGLLKNLDARDIIEQWFAATHELGATIDNIVFMGMGEPMDNLDAVLRSIEVLVDRNGPAIAPSRITVSTVGRSAGIRRLSEFARRGGFRGLKLAVSMNAPNDAVRRTIMPIARAEPMDALMAAMQCWHDRVLIEYVVIPGVNDAPQHAEELAAYLQPLHCTVNVIPYNPRRDSPWPAPAEERVQAFMRQLSKYGLRVTRRRTTGRSVAAACGQLGVSTRSPRLHRVAVKP